MRLVQAQSDLRVADASGSPVYALRGGQTYLLHREEVQSAGTQAPLRILGEAQVPPTYDGRPLRGERIAFPFIGKLGDALVAAACVAALAERYPGIRVDFAAVPAAREVLDLVHRSGAILEYPLTADRLEAYDHLMSFAGLDAASLSAGSLADSFSACLRTPRPTTFPRVEVDVPTRRRWERRLGSAGYTAIHPGPDGGLRSLPGPLLHRLLDDLLVSGVRVLLLGDASAGPQGSPPGDVLDLRGRTKSVADLTAVLMCVEALVTGDSFPLHLAGAMGLPTVALFAPTDRVLASDYPSVTALASSFACSPCGTATGGCPLGQRTCLAWRDDSLSSRRVLDAALHCVRAG